MAFRDTVEPDWITTPQTTFSGGLNKEISEDQLKAEEVTEAINLRLEGNKVIGDKGYFPYNWIETTLFASYTAGGTVISTNDNVRYKVIGTADVKILLDNGTYFTTTISSFLGAAAFNIASALPSDAGINNKVYIDKRIIGNPTHIHRLILKSGASDSFLFCTDDTSNKAGVVYRDTGIDWDPVIYDPGTGGSTTLVNAETRGTSTGIDLTSATGFAQYDYIRIQLGVAGSEYHACQIASIAAAVIVIDPALPEACSALNTVERIMEFTGAVDDRITVTTVPWGDDLIATNGVDQIPIYENSTQKFRDLDTSTIAGGTVLARVVRIFDNRVVFGYLEYGGVTYPQRVLWGATGDAEDYTNGSNVDLYEDEGEIATMLQLGPAMYVYKKQKGIYRMAKSQRLDRDFDFDQMITNHGTISVYGVEAIDDNSHMVWDIDNIFKYTGGFGIQRIGDKIRDILYGTNGNLDVGYVARASMIKLRETNELLLVYQSSADSSSQTNAVDAGPMTALRYKIDLDRWTTRQFNIPIFAIGKSDVTNSQSWAQTDGTWASQSGSWSSSFISGGAETSIIAGQRADSSSSPVRNGQTFRYAQIDEDDNGVAISYTLTSKDFVEEGEIRLDWMDLRASGGSILIEVSTDEGLNWATYGTVAASTKLSKYRIHKQMIVRSHKWRFTSSNPAFEIDGFRLRVAPETERD